MQGRNRKVISGEGVFSSIHSVPFLLFLFPPFLPSTSFSRCEVAPEIQQRDLGERCTLVLQRGKNDICNLQSP